MLGMPSISGAVSTPRGVPDQGVAVVFIRADDRAPPQRVHSAPPRVVAEPGGYAEGQVSVGDVRVVLLAVLVAVVGY
jgi:hypothetical protein